MAKLLQLCKHVLGLPKCITILRPVVSPSMRQMATHMHASGIVDGTTICLFEQISARAVECVLQRGFMPLLLGLADLRVAVDSGDPTAFRKEAAVFGEMVLADAELTYEALCRLEVYRWLQPAIVLCVEEFEVFRRYLTMLVHAMEEAYLEVSSRAARTVLALSGCNTGGSREMD